MKKSYELADLLRSKVLFTQTEKILDPLAHLDFEELIKRYESLVEASVEAKTPKLLREKPELKSEFADDWLQYFQSLIRQKIQKQIEPLFSRILRSGIYSTIRTEINELRRTESSVHEFIQTSILESLEVRYAKHCEGQEEEDQPGNSS